MKTRFSTRELSQRLGITHQYVKYILSGERVPSARMAEQLEKVTGVKREAWVWPEKYANPYVIAYAEHKKERRNAS